MLHAPALALLLASSEIDLSARQAELDACAERIEELKARHAGGRELERLLRRAEELGAEIDRARAGEDAEVLEQPPAPASPGAEELRERADAARDEIDRLSAEIAALDVRIEDARHARSEPGAPIARAAIGGAPTAPDRLHALLGERAGLSERRARAEAEAAQLERDARAAERDERDP